MTQSVSWIQIGLVTLKFSHFIILILFGFSILIFSWPCNYFNAFEKLVCFYLCFLYLGLCLIRSSSLYFIYILLNLQSRDTGATSNHVYACIRIDAVLWLAIHVCSMLLHCVTLQLHEEVNDKRILVISKSRREKKNSICMRSYAESWGHLRPLISLAHGRYVIRSDSKIPHLFSQHDDIANGQSFFTTHKHTHTVCNTDSVYYIRYKLMETKTFVFFAVVCAIGHSNKCTRDEKKCRQDACF